MAGVVGRGLTLTVGGTVLAGIRTLSLTYAGESINITSGENDGKRHLLEESAEESIDASIEGIMKTDTLRAYKLAGNVMLTNATITYPVLVPGNTAATLTGNFRLSNLEEGYPYNDAVTFSGSLESSGPWVYTAETTPA